jgi:hypothetical protein
MCVKKCKGSGPPRAWNSDSWTSVPPGTSRPKRHSAKFYGSGTPARRSTPYRCMPSKQPSLKVSSYPCFHCLLESSEPSLRRANSYLVLVLAITALPKTRADRLLEYHIWPPICSSNLFPPTFHQDMELLWGDMLSELGDIVTSCLRKLHRCSAQACLLDTLARWGTEPRLWHMSGRLQLEGKSPDQQDKTRSSLDRCQ